MLTPRLFGGQGHLQKYPFFRRERLQKLKEWFFSSHFIKSSFQVTPKIMETVTTKLLTFVSIWSFPFEMHSGTSSAWKEKTRMADLCLESTACIQKLLITPPSVYCLLDSRMLDLPWLWLVANLTHSYLVYNLLTSPGPSLDCHRVEHKVESL